MQRLWEILFGLQRGFLSREGELSLQFNPRWPGQDLVGAATINAVLIALAAALVVYVYRREGRPTATRAVLGAVRFALLLLVIGLLNRPLLTLVQSRTEPSVLAVLVDDSVSMRVADAGPTPEQPRSRLEAAIDLLTASDRALLRKLAGTHEIRFYKFDREAQPVAATPAPVRRQADEAAVNAAAVALAQLKPTGDGTAVPSALATVLQELQGQRMAGVVVLTDGRETPARPLSESLAALKSYGAKIFPVAVGTDQPPRNVQIESVAAQDATFKGDVLNVRATIRGTGFTPGQEIELVLKDRKTGQPLVGEDGQPVRETVALDGAGGPVEVELQAKPEQVGTLDVLVEARREPGEIDDEDNSRAVQVAVLDTKVNLLYVDGYPRWEYRYLKNEMIRDKTVDVSVILTSADAGFAQEGDRPIQRFPESVGEMLDYDVVLIGDVDPRQFTDAQLQLIADFVATKGGGFGMVAGPRYSPHAYRGTPLEALLPVNIARTAADAVAAPITEGFRPVVTRDGAATGIFRFFANRAQNDGFLRDAIKPLYWYARGATAKPGVGEVLAEHPSDVGPDGRKAPLLVMGRYGAGRTLFSAIDDSWRWRYYTGESVFDTYWVQQVRQLARGRKIGQRRLTLAADRPVYELGQQVRLTLRVLDPVLLQQLPDAIRVELLGPDGAVRRQETMNRQSAPGGGLSKSDTYTGGFSTDAVGKFAVRLAPVAAGVDTLDVPVDVTVPRLELADPTVDRGTLARLAAETGGRSLDLAQAAAELPALLPSAAKNIPVVTATPLWDAPLAMALFVLLITAEWVVRKLNGMV